MDPNEALTDKVKLIADRWFTEDEPAERAKDRAAIIKAITHTKKSRHVAAALALELERREPLQGHRFVGALQYAEERNG